MVRPKRGETTLTTDEIKRVARQQMSEQGAAGISLRGIARQLGVTAPAIYNYFPRLDDLYTELIIDAYHGLAGALRAAADPHQPPGARLLAVLLAYRAWALDHPAEFSLIFGTPIPGYQAPAARTLPAAQSVFAVILAILAEAQARGLLRLPPGTPPMPPGLRVALPPSAGAPALPDLVVYVGVAGWYRIHGMIMLELFGHTPEMLSDPAAYYEYEVKLLIQQYLLEQEA